MLSISMGKARFQGLYEVSLSHSKRLSNSGEQPHNFLLPIQPSLPTHNHRLPLQGLLSKQSGVGGLGALTPPIALLTGPPGGSHVRASHVGSLTAGGFTDVR